MQIGNFCLCSGRWARGGWTDGWVGGCAVNMEMDRNTLAINRMLRWMNNLRFSSQQGWKNWGRCRWMDAWWMVLRLECCFLSLGYRGWVWNYVWMTTPTWGGLLILDKESQMLRNTWTSGDRREGNIKVTKMQDHYSDLWFDINQKRILFWVKSEANLQLNLYF